LVKEAKTVKIKNSDGKELEVTEKAYRVVYAPQGFREVKEDEEKKSSSKRSK
jgi:hypothetical protein